LSQEGAKKILEREKRYRRLLFWNVMGIGRQDMEFWNYIARKDYICLNETWLEEKGWSRIKKNLPDTHRWEYETAKRNKKKGRAKGGFIIEIKKDWGVPGSSELKISKGEGITVSRVKSK